jgi:ADP-ribosylglycohydrolase
MTMLLAKATGCLAGVALGDALGRATEFMTREDIRARFGWLDRFAAPPEYHPGHGDPLGTITDDTEQTLIIADLLAAGGALTPEVVAAGLMRWARRRDGLANPYLGPSTRRALAALLNGTSPHETGKGGTTNGAAMRVAPIGIAHAGALEGTLADAVAASIPTHNTHNAMQAAGAVACAVAAAMREDATIAGVITAAQEGARRGRSFGAWSWSTPLEKRIELAERLVGDAGSVDETLDLLYNYVGVGLDPAESVATAFGLVILAQGDPMAAILYGVNIGGDTDTIAGIAGGVCGALRGIDALDAALVAQLEQVNGLNLRAVAGGLLR